MTPTNDALREALTPLVEEMLSEIAASRVSTDRARNFITDYEQERLRLTHTPLRARSICAARRQSTAGGNDPIDCNWPMCGCDPYASKVIATLQESGYALAQSPAPDAGLPACSNLATLADRLSGPHEWGYRDITDGTFIEDRTPFDVAAALSSPPAQSQDIEGVEQIDIAGRVRDVDASIAPIVRALNAAGLTTIASCSGHGSRPSNIALTDGREIIIARNYEEGRLIDGLFPIGANGEPVERPAPDATVREKVARQCAAIALEEAATDEADGEIWIARRIHDRILAALAQPHTIDAGEGGLRGALLRMVDRITLEGMAGGVTSAKHGRRYVVMSFEQYEHDLEAMRLRGRRVLGDAVMAVVDATRAYLPPDGITALDCINRVIEATDNPTIYPIVLELEQARATPASPRSDVEQG